MSADLDQDILDEFEGDWGELELLNVSQQSTQIQEWNSLESANGPSKEQLQVLHTCFGHKTFRPMQWKIINSIINDRKDNCAIMATGYGKSLCYQYPAVFCGGVTIVISPLISLMEDQVLSLNMSNISACLLGSAQKEKRKVLDEILENKYSVVYMTPEYCCTDFGAGYLQKMDEALSLVLVAIDEAHCVSSWGHDFRFSYRGLNRIRNTLPRIPILAVTATATQQVRDDIVKSLRLRNPQILCSGFDRPNLYFIVHMKSKSVFNDLSKYMTSKNAGSTIIYCITKKHTEELADNLKAEGIECAVYHAGLGINTRKEVHEQFVKDKIKVIVATIAFGMGIDKPDVRQIIHYGASKDMESYYQEVGRAGRDGEPAKCITFYSNADFIIHKHMMDLTNTNNPKYKEHKETMNQKMAQYLDTRDCRRQFILSHFEGKTATNPKPRLNCCDNCTRKLKDCTDSEKYEDLDANGLYDFTADGFKFISAVEALDGRFGVSMYVLFIKGSTSSKVYERYRRLPLYGAGSKKTEEWWKVLARILEREKYLVPYKMKHSSKNKYNLMGVKVGPKGEQFLRDKKADKADAKILLQPPPEWIKFLKTKHKETSDWEQSQPENETRIIKYASQSRASTSQSSPNLMKISKLSQYKAPSPTAKKSQDPYLVDDKETTALYTSLLTKRSELATVSDCMPYMVASTDVLMQMAIHKPVSINDLRNEHFNGFTEGKINKFGEEFIKVIRKECNIFPVHTQPRTIQELMPENRLPDFLINSVSMTTCVFYMSGMTVEEIATKRGLIPTTVVTHLIDGIKMGYRIKLIDLNVTDEIRDTVVSVIRSPAIKSETFYLHPIKKLCPEYVTLEHIRIIAAYLRVRDHLDSLNLKYIDFESPLGITIPNSTEVPVKKEEAPIIIIDDDEQPKKKFKPEKFKFKEKKCIYYSAFDPPET